MKLKLTKRDLAVACVAAALTGAIFALPAATPAILRPSTFPWQSLRPAKTPFGEVRQVVKSPTATLEQLEIHITTLNPGQSPHPPHRHPNEELILIDHGTLETLSDGKWVRLGPGSVILNAANALHGLRNVGDDPALYFVVNWRTPATDALAIQTPANAAAPPH